MKHISPIEEFASAMNQEPSPKLNDRTEHLQTERRLRLHIAVTRALAESSSLVDAVPRVLKALCIVGSWDYGEMWNIDAGKDHLNFEGAWHDPKIDVQKLLDATQKTKFGYGQWVPGRVWVTGKPVWLKEVALLKESPLSVHISELGFHTAVAFPVRDLFSLLGVIVLFRREARETDNNLLEMFYSLGTQIGDFVKRKRAEEALKQSEQRFRALIEQSSDAITLLSAQGNILYMSPSAERLFGYLPVEFLGQNAFEFIHPDDREHSKKLMASVMRTPGSSVSAEYRFRHKNGSWRWMEGIGTNLLHDPAVQAIVTNNRDITERKHAEEEIRKLNEELELRVQRRTEQLEDANKELETFSYSVSHDLRAPLRAIDGFARELSEHSSAKLSDEGQRYLSIIRTKTKKMGTLIDDLLTFSRVSRVEFEKIAIDMHLLVQSVVDEVLKGITGPLPEVILADLPPARGSLSMIRQVLSNLLSNAVKFSRNNPSPRIEIGHVPSETLLTYFVKDNGVGFAMRFADKLFGVFQRLHDENEFEGTGVGLAIVQRVIHRHGGKVWAESELNKGSTFFFTLPKELKKI